MPDFLGAFRPLPDLDARFLEEFEALMLAIRVPVDDLLDADVDEGNGAEETGFRRDVDLLLGGIASIDLDQAVDLRMKMPACAGLIGETPIVEPSGRPVIPQT